MKIVADCDIPYIQDYFSHYGELILLPGRTMNAQEVQDADMLIVRAVTKVDASLLANSRVKFVGSITAGFDHLDTQWLNQAGIAWRVAAGFNAPPVADYVVSNIAYLQQQQLLTTKQPIAAVIGVGHVGRLVAERLRILGFNVLLTDPIRAQQEKDFISTPLPSLSEVDLVALHVPLTYEGENATYHFINSTLLKQLKPGCVLLNASRGPVIATDDLKQYGKHLHCCLDVWEHEPHLDSELLARAVIATPHIAGYSVQSKIRGITLIHALACAQGFLPPLPVTLPTVAPKTLQTTSDWRTTVLQVFNPHLLTLELQKGAKFDVLRKEFNDRYEFSALELMPSKADLSLLQALGFSLQPSRH